MITYESTRLAAEFLLTNYGADFCKHLVNQTPDDATHAIMLDVLWDHEHPKYTRRESGPRHTATMDSTPEQQARFYEELMQAYTLRDELEQGVDYFLDTTVNGFLYYQPNDESWGAVIAVDHATRLAVDTGFYETADFEPIKLNGFTYPSDYAIGFDGNKLVCNFQNKTLITGPWTATN